MPKAPFAGHHQVAQSKSTFGNDSIHGGWQRRGCALAIVRPSLNFHRISHLPNRFKLFPSTVTSYRNSWKVAKPGSAHVYHHGRASFSPTVCRSNNHTCLSGGAFFAL